MAQRVVTGAITNAKGEVCQKPTLSLAALSSRSTDEVEGTTTNDSPRRSNVKAPNAHKADLKKLLKNPMCWGRIITLILALILLILSVGYCIAQELRVELQLLTTCDSPKSQQEIWEHSYRSGLQSNGEVVMNAESQYGHTDDACWTTKSIAWDTDKIWFSNHDVIDGEIPLN